MQKTDGAVMAETLATSPSAGISGRLKAWWNGDEAPDAQAEKKMAKAREAAAAEDVEEDFPSPSGVAEWTPQRIASIQRLYGEGNDGPSSRDRTRDLVNPIGLNAEMTVPNISARLGTTARTIAKDTGAWVDGVEWNNNLVEEAVRLSAKEGLVKKAVIRNLELDDPEIREHKRDAIVIRECLYQIPERERLFKTLADLLKPSSHLLVTEFLVNPSKGQEERAEWSALHRTVPRLFELDEVREGLNKVGFDVRVAKDETKSYKAALLSDIRKFGDSVPNTPLSRELQEWVMSEVEYWARTFAALDAGGITMHRIHAVTPMADPTKT
ncbi:MAG: methyltransferase domain-containing protein [Alphaproteobacteria bacterium]